MTLYKNKYRIESTRLKGRDYSSPGAYFITTCTKNKIPYFGEITDGQIVLSGSGKIVKKYWREIPDHFGNTKLDEFVVMPDHIHGILIIDNNNDNHNVEMPNLGVSTLAVRSEKIPFYITKPSAYPR